MTTIPSNEIKQPRLHADTLGFTFIWNNHFLRGIYPSAVKQAKSYFESGFIDEVVSKQLFPKTWISEFENEQFGMILEHEMISPVLYATEWNFEMLKDAALMVLEIAQVGWKYGYNMVDCHKLNVMFSNNRPVYVDLGSFVPRKKGSTGWNPYSEFLRSYYYILAVWSDGASTLAKRMMAPGLEFDASDYYIYKDKFYRCFPKLIRWRTLIQEGVYRLAAWEEERVAGHGKAIIIAKWFVDRFKLSPSQRLNSVKKRIASKSVRKMYDTKTNNMPLYENLAGFINEYCTDCKSATFINNPVFEYYPMLLQQTKVKTIVSVQEKNGLSCYEYKKSRQTNVNLCCASFKLMNNTILIRKKYPETRLNSELVIVSDISIGKGKFGVHNALVLIEHCFLYAKKYMIIILHSSDEELVQQLSMKYEIETLLTTTNIKNILLSKH